MQRRLGRALLSVGPLLACAALAASSAAASSTSHITPKIRPGTYSGTVTMSPVYQSPSSNVSITLSGTWKLNVDQHDHVTGSESLAGTMPISPSGGCTASPDSYTLGFAARFGRTQVGFAITGAPGFVKGNVLVVALDSSTGTGATTDQGWSATPGSYQLTCGSLPPGSEDILFFGELGVVISHYTLHLPLALFRKIGYSSSINVENVENAKFTQTFKLTHK